MSTGKANGLGRGGQRWPSHATASPFAPASTSLSHSDAHSGQHATLAQGLNLLGVDMSALAGVSPEQMALIARLFQAGALPLPPAALAAPSSVSATLSSADIGPASIVTKMPLGLSERSGIADADMDREDGELEDDKRPEERSKSISGQNLSQVPVTDLGLREPALAAQTSDVHLSTGQPSKELAAKQFVLEMVKAGYTFDQLSRHVDSNKLLRRLFGELGLQAPAQEASDGTSTKPMSSTLVTPSAPTSSSTPADVVLKNTATKRAAPSNVKAVDRSEYLARLQAAKTKKPDAVATLPVPTEPLQTQLAEVKAVPETPRTKAIAFAQLSPASKMEKDKLLRARLAAVKAEYAAKQAAKQSSAVLPSDESSAHSQQAESAAIDAPRTALALAPLSNGLGADIANVGSLAAQQATRVTPAVMKPLPGLPGLSTKTPPAHVPTLQSPQHAATAASALDQTLPVNPRKRPVAADFDDAPAKSTPHKRPFGQSRGNSEDESMIIEDSDGDNDDDDGVNGVYTNDELSSDFPNSRPQTRPFRDVGPLSDFPHRMNHPPRTPVPGTPGDLTPGGSDLLRFNQEIEEMRRKIAEMEKKKSASKAVASVQRSATSTPIAPQDVSRSQTKKDRLRQKIQELERGGLRATSGNGLPGLIGANGGLHREEAGPASSHLVPTTDTDVSLSHSQDYTSLPSHELRDDSSDDPSDESISNFYQPQPTPIEHDTASVDDEQSTSDSMSESSEDESEDEAEAEDTQQEADSQRRSAGAEESTAPQAELGSVSTAMQDVPMDESEAPVEDNIAGDSSHRQSSLEQTASVALVGPNHIELVAGAGESGEIVSSSASATDSDDDEQQPIPGKISLGSTPGLVDHSTPESLGGFVNEKKSQPGMSVAGTAADDLAPELQPSQEQQASLSIKSTDGALTRLAPYVSPLAAFKDFRFHPAYLQSVPGGFRSLTYSHNIDMDQPICPYEAAGGQCNDKSCPGQHFATMALNDNEILRNLATKRAPVHSDEDQARWTSGLTALIQDLRQQNLGNDVEVIAARLAEYRRQFVGDPSKVLHLG